jgi:hypothetical protein
MTFSLKIGMLSEPENAVISKCIYLLISSSKYLLFSLYQVCAKLYV